MNQLKYVSYIKIWAMIMVVFYHCLCGYSNIWGGDFSWKVVPMWYHLAHILVYFHMPIFTIMSAYLYGYLDSKNKYCQPYLFINKKVKRLLIPYLIWGTILCLVEKCDVSYLLFGISHLWYLMFLFEAFIIFHFILRISNLNKFIIFIVLYTICCIINKYYPTPFLGLGYFVRYMPYFVIGYYLYFILEKINIRHSYLTWINTICSLLFIMTYNIYNNKFVLTILSLGIIFCLVELCKQKNHLLGKQERFLRLDKYIIGIYLIHHIIIQEVNHSFIGQSYMHHYIIYPILLFVASFGISLLLTYILQKCKLGRTMLGIK